MNELLKLKDIKPNVPVNIAHHCPYYIWLIAIVTILLVLLLIIFINKHLKIKKEKEALLNLLNNPKKFAYEFTKKAKKYKNKKNKEFLEEIIMRLNEYKYKPVVENIDQKTVEMIKKYLEIK